MDEPDPFAWVGEGLEEVRLERVETIVRLVYTASYEKVDIIYRILKDL